MCSMWGLRVSRFFDLEVVFGSKSDKPSRAKNDECMIRKWTAKGKNSISHPPSLMLWQTGISLLCVDT